MNDLMPRLNGETYFFRDLGQFDLLRLHILPKLIEQRSAEKHLRLWSAGCASGGKAVVVALIGDQAMEPTVDAVHDVIYLRPEELLAPPAILRERSGNRRHCAVFRIMNCIAIKSLHLDTDYTAHPSVLATKPASLASILAAVVGVMVLVGWAFDIATLKSILPGWVNMKANVAVCFILTGIARSL
jgi:hypothetical protein